LWLEEEDLTGGAYMAAREREGAGYRFGEKSRWAAGWFLFWADSVPLGLLLFLFSFLFSYLIHNFCKIHPNQFKPFSKIQYYALTQQEN
jgi:hypothetical protein